MGGKLTLTQMRVILLAGAVLLLVLAVLPRIPAKYGFCFRISGEDRDRRKAYQRIGSIEERC